MQPTKKYVLLFFSIGALLLAGRFFFGPRENKIEPENLKPGQLDFSKSNEVQPLPAPAPAAPEPPPVSSAPPAAVSRLSAGDQKLWSDFESVLKSRNDNDPRINSELRHLSPDLHAALFEAYRALPSESRNERGFVVFLVARDLNSPADLNFLEKVYEEAPCLGLEDCKVNVSDDPHYSGMNQTTLNYPQFAALYQIEKQLEERPQILKDPALREGVVTVLKQADNFPVPAVQKKSGEIRRKYGL